MQPVNFSKNFLVRTKGCGNIEVINLLKSPILSYLYKNEKSLVLPPKIIQSIQLQQQRSQAELYEKYPSKNNDNFPQIEDQENIEPLQQEKHIENSKDDIGIEDIQEKEIKVDQPLAGVVDEYEEMINEIKSGASSKQLSPQNGLKDKQSTTRKSQLDEEVTKYANKLATV